jgi:glutamyl-tRNA synthetase
MDKAEVKRLATAFSLPDFKKIEPDLAILDKYLTLRTYVEGYTLSPADHELWIALRSNKVANAFLKKGSLVNVSRWFLFIEETHPEIQSEIKVADDAVKAKKAALSKAGASYNMALQDTDKGVVCRFPPEPSYVPVHVAGPALIILQWISSHRPCKGSASQ